MLHTAELSQSTSPTRTVDGTTPVKEELKKILRFHGLDYVESIWLIACTASKNPIDQCKRYLEKCGIAFIETPHVQPDEFAGIREHSLAFDAKGNVQVIVNRLCPLSAPIHIIEIRPGTSEQTDHGQFDQSGFWKSLMNAGWLKESMALGFPTYAPLVLTSILINLLALAPAVFSMQVYDRVIPNKAFESLFALALGVLICLMFEQFLKKARHGLVEHAATLMDLSCSKRLSTKLLNAQSHQTTAGKLLQHLRSFEQLRELITGISLVSLVDLPFLLIFLGVLALIHPFFLMAALVTIAVSVLNVLIIHRKLQKAGQKQISLLRLSQTEWISTASHLPVLQKLGIQDLRSDSLTEMQLSQRIAGNDVRNLIFTSNQRQHSIQQIGWLSIIVLGALLSADNFVTIGGMIAASMLSMRAFTPLLKIQGHLVQSHIARAGFQELDRFLTASDQEQPQDLGLPELQRIELNQVKVELQPGIAQLEGICLSLRPGDKLALIGPNGSGKTTLLNLLAVAYPIAEGGLLLNGLDSSRIPHSEIARHIAMSDQPPSILEGTILSNIKMDRPWVSTEDCLRILGELHMLDWIESLPKGLHTEVASAGVNLSAGKRQMLSIARTLAGNPKLILLDEPSVCLDQTAETYLVKCIESLPKDKIVVLATHRKAMLAPMTHIVVMDKGRIVQHGKRDEILGKLPETPRST